MIFPTIIMHGENATRGSSESTAKEKGQESLIMSYEGPRTSIAEESSTKSQTYHGCTPFPSNVGRPPRNIKGVPNPSRQLPLSTVSIYTHHRDLRGSNDDETAPSYKFAQYWSRLKKRFRRGVDSDTFKKELLVYIQAQRGRGSPKY